MNLATSQPVEESPWKLLSQARRRANWVTGLYSVVVFLLMVINISQSRRLDRIYLKQIEDQRQIITLVAENRRLRGNCPTGPTPSRGLANNQSNRR